MFTGGGGGGIAIVIGGKSVSSKRNKKPISTRFDNGRNLWLRRSLKQNRVKSIKVLGVSKRTCQRHQEATTSRQVDPHIWKRRFLQTWGERLNSRNQRHTTRKRRRTWVISLLDCGKSWPLVRSKQTME